MPAIRNSGPAFGQLGPVELFAGQLQNGPQQAHLGVANAKLRRMDADGQSAHAGGRVVADQSALPLLVETPRAVQRQRASRDDQPFAEGFELRAGG